MSIGQHLAWPRRLFALGSICLCSGLIDLFAKAAGLYDFGPNASIALLGGLGLMGIAVLWGLPILHKHLDASDEQKRRAEPKSLPGSCT